MKSSRASYRFGVNKNSMRMGLVAGMAGLGLMLVAGSVVAEEKKDLESTAKRMSYAMGVEMARNFKKQGMEIDPELVARGMRDGYADKPQLSDKELRVTMNGFQAEIRQKMAQNKRAMAEENKTRGAAFLEANKKKDGVVVLASGLQYRVIKAGDPDGRKATDADVVECRYRGTLLNGTEFDATEPGKSASLKVSALIPGWREALRMMTPGSRWELFIPATLAYGERGAGSDIGPNETLLFEIELVGVK